MQVTFQTEYAGTICVSANTGENLLALARRADVAMDAPCAGGSTCGKCRVKLLSGSLESLPSWHITPSDYEAGWRLACCSRVVEDCTVFVPDRADAYRKGIRNPEEISRLLATGSAFRYTEAHGQVGCAMDIGTTTVSTVLTDLKTGQLLAKAYAGNEQIRYGGDVIHRIIAQSRPGGRKALQDAILEKTLVPMMEAMRRDAGIQPEAIGRIVVAANTTMNHLLLGVDANPIRVEPYMPAFLEKEGVTAGALGLPADPLAPVILAPNVGSYVGGDITAGMLAAGMWQKEELSLFIDLGTNGEIVLGNREFLLACACSAGPAFEGGELSCGMRATRGAVETVSIDGDTLEPTVQVVGGGKPAGICGSGIIDLVAQLFAHKVIDPRGTFIREGVRILRDGHGVGRYVLAFPQESSTGAEVSVSEVDLDSFIRAKAAIYAGIETLLQSVDMTPDCMEKILVAGGIGSGINIQNAISVGMLPNVEKQKYQYIGNSSLAGAYAMVLSREAEEACKAVAANMTYLELSAHPGYMDSFVAACFLPHTRADLFQ